MCSRKPSHTLLRLTIQHLAIATKGSALILPKMADTRPSFSSLPLRDGDPEASAWGLWGSEDELGTLNLLTPEVVAKASQEVKTGEVVPLK